MVALHAASTTALSPAFLHDVRTLLDTAFEGDFTDEDWDHAIGGVHVRLIGSRGLISHGSLVERTLVCSGKTLHVGYVEAVATAASHRRKGYGARVMKAYRRTDSRALPTGRAVDGDPRPLQDSWLGALAWTDLRGRSQRP